MLKKNTSGICYLYTQISIKMRIGVITIEAGHNYGGILQCYAFMKQLQSYGHEVEFLRVYPHNYGLIDKIRSILATRNIFSLIFGKKSHAIFSKEESEEMTIVFDKFREEYMKLSPLQTYKTVGEYANKNYDAIFIGSDQTWAGLYNRNNAVFIGWQPKFRGIKMSYACCSPYKHIYDPIRKHQLANFLNDFRYISVRDKNTQALIRNITGQIVDIVPDPTELMSFEEFVQDVPIVKGKYIVVYVLGDEINGGHKLALNRIKKQFGDIPVIGIKTANSNTGVHAVADHMINSLTPQQWVNLIYNATVVYTDSFHAILFSLKFKKPFIAYYTLSVRASRLLYLKEKYKTNNIVSCIKEIRNAEVLKYESIDVSFFDELMRNNGLL